MIWPFNTKAKTAEKTAMREARREDASRARQLAAKALVRVKELQAQIEETCPPETINGDSS